MLEAPEGAWRPVSPRLNSAIEAGHKKGVPNHVANLFKAAYFCFSGVRWTLFSFLLKYWEALHMQLPRRHFTHAAPSSTQTFLNCPAPISLVSRKTLPIPEERQPFHELEGSKDETLMKEEHRNQSSYSLGWTPGCFQHQHTPSTNRKKPQTLHPRA